VPRAVVMFTVVAVGGLMPPESNDTPPVKVVEAESLVENTPAPVLLLVEPPITTVKLGLFR